MHLYPRMGIAIVASLAMTSTSFAIDLGRCQNLPPIITPDTVIPGADITEQVGIYKTVDVTETRDILERRDVLENQKQYSTTATKGHGGGHDGSQLRCQLPNGKWSMAPSIDYAGHCGPALGLTGGDYGSATFIIVPVKVGEVDVKVGEEVVKVGEKEVKIGEKTVVIGKEPDTVIEVPDIPQYQTGQVDVKESAKAYAAAVIEAIKNGEKPPKPGPQFEVIDWNPPGEGSC